MSFQQIVPKHTLIKLASLDRTIFVNTGHKSIAYNYEMDENADSVRKTL